jgi:NADH dehydrogenase
VTPHVTSVDGAEKGRRVVVVGAGFGGLFAARRLARSGLQVVLIDRRNFHTFTPLLYQVAAAELEPEEIAYPLRSVFRGQKNLHMVLGEVRRVDLSSRQLEVGDVSIGYEDLILALGSTTNFFGVDGASDYSWPLKTPGDAVRLRSHILECFERAQLHSEETGRAPLITFVIVGGGPTGVEFAGALSELIRGPLARDFPSLDLSESKVILVEASNSLLGGFPQHLGMYGARRLRQMGVEVRFDATVTAVGPHSVAFASGEAIESATVVWTAGVRGDPALERWGLPTTRDGRVPVDDTLHVPGDPHVYVIGDSAYVEQAGRALPMLAPVAIQQGEAAADNILRAASAKPARVFRYRDKGTMATIGRNAAVAVLAGHAFSGFSAWIIWLAIHITSLIGFRNRLLVLTNWAWDYLFFERGVRLIDPGP